MSVGSVVLSAGLQLLCLGCGHPRMAIRHFSHKLPVSGGLLGVPPRMGTEPGLQADPLRLRGKLKMSWILSYTLHVMSVFSCQLSWKGPSFGTQKLGDLRGRPWVNNTDSQHANELRNLFHVYSRWLKIVDPLKVAAVFWRLHIRG